MHNDDVTDSNGIGRTSWGSSLTVGVSQLKKIFRPPPFSEVIHCFAQMLHPTSQVIRGDFEFSVIIDIGTRIWECKNSSSDQ